MSIIFIFLGFSLVSGLYSSRLVTIFITSSFRRKIAVFLFLILATLLLSGRILSRLLGDFPGVDIIILIGSYWFGLMIYLTMGTFIVDTLMFASYIVRKLKLIQYSGVNIRKKASVVVIIVSLGLIICGSFNARNPVITDIEISSPLIKNDITIAFVSDIHLGRILGITEIMKIRTMMAKINPDMIIMGGDQFDESLIPVIKRRYPDYIAGLKAPLGVYAVTGNHEYIDDADEAIAILEKSGIKVLRDTIVNVGSILLVGRDDIRGLRVSGIPRKSLNEIIRHASRKKPIVVIDHQPAFIHESVDENVLLHLSGHTHHGQLWPVGYITDRIFEVGSGYRKIRETNVYVSSGFGTWGPPVRVGNRPEIVRIVLREKRTRN